MLSGGLGTRDKSVATEESGRRGNDTSDIAEDLDVCLGCGTKWCAAF